MHGYSFPVKRNVAVRPRLVESSVRAVENQNKLGENDSFTTLLSNDGLDIFPGFPGLLLSDKQQSRLIALLFRPLSRRFSRCLSRLTVMSFLRVYILLHLWSKSLGYRFKSSADEISDDGAVEDLEYRYIDPERIDKEATKLDSYQRIDAQILWIASSIIRDYVSSSTSI
jgi:hypothetical protein